MFDDAPDGADSATTPHPTTAPGFRDYSKNASRRWCSIRVCGNRATVRTFAERRRTPAG
ncbi:CGNR zinc finger domain-containing protein [Actinomadura coerulea]|uniref:CGNR zinc finger domain-containing protein n=1 Tax=Actinomadura coerulea TaxID=46159 RepID=UPI00343D74F8